MRAVDTNVIVHYLTGDDPEQAAKVRDVIGHEPIFVPRTVLLETEWGLRGAYGLAPGRIIATLRALAGLPGVSVEDADLVATAMDWAEAGMDFADALHVAAAGGCESFLTFDKRLARAGGRRGHRLGRHRVAEAARTRGRAQGWRSEYCALRRMPSGFPWLGEERA